VTQWEQEIHNSNSGVGEYKGGKKAGRDLGTFWGTSRLFRGTGLRHTYICTRSATRKGEMTRDKK
jgi:hypothetical protein